MANLIDTTIFGNLTVSGTIKQNSTNNIPFLYFSSNADGSSATNFQQLVIDPTVSGTSLTALTIEKSLVSYF